MFIPLILIGKKLTNSLTEQTKPRFTHMSRQAYIAFLVMVFLASLTVLPRYIHRPSDYDRQAVLVRCGAVVIESNLIPNAANFDDVVFECNRLSSASFKNSFVVRKSQPLSYDESVFGVMYRQKDKREIVVVNLVDKHAYRFSTTGRDEISFPVSLNAYLQNNSNIDKAWFHWTK